jgi:hypothetical protein
MNVHSATCSCSVELYELWYTLADFFQTGIFAGFFYISLSGTVERYTHPPWQPEFGPEEKLFCFLKSRGVFFSLYIINFVRRISETALGGEGAICFSGCRVAHLE